MSVFLSCSSTQKAAPVTHFRGFAHTMPYHIQIGRPLSAAEKKQVTIAIHGVLTTVDRVYNHWNAQSELSFLNATPADQPLSLSPELYQLLDLARSISNLTDGRFDPTLGKVIAQWKEHLIAGELPTHQKLTECATGWELIEFDAHSVTKKITDLQLDLDGIAKGYAIDQLAQAFSHLGITQFYINWGGDLRIMGCHPEKRPWQVLLPQFRISHDPACRLSLTSGGLATSGDYEQAWTIDATTYSHIIDPTTKTAITRSNNSLAAVTIYAPTCALADAIATAAMTFPSSQELLFWIETLQQTYPDLRCWVLSYDKEPKAAKASFREASVSTIGNG
ncbi:MAG: FAD:protein FMN transferase [Chlamydiota bacterium]